MNLHNQFTLPTFIWLVDRAMLRVKFRAKPLTIIANEDAIGQDKGKRQRHNLCMVS